MKKIISLSILTLISFLSESFAMNLTEGEEAALRAQVSKLSLEGDFGVHDFLPVGNVMMCIDDDCAPLEQYASQQTTLFDESADKMSCYGFVPGTQQSYGTLHFGDTKSVDDFRQVLVPSIIPPTSSQSEPLHESLPVVIPTAVPSVPVKTRALQEVTNRAFKDLCEMGPVYPISSVNDPNKENRQLSVGNRQPI